MTTRSKIVGLTRHKSEEPAAPAEEVADIATDAAASEDFAADDSVDEAEEWQKPGLSRLLVPGILLTAAISWTAFFAVTYWPEVRGGVANSLIINLVATWAVPALLIAVIWLLAMRNSSREATRFGNVASLLRAESDALHQRMRAVNEEISIAREFLAQNARELESVGRQSSLKLVESAERLASALADSDAKAKTLEAVSEAANTNLEQLRKNLPVVTSAAKDVTNQIGHAGNDAQTQIKALIATLERVGDAGKSVRHYVDDIENKADTLAVRLEDSLRSSAQLLETKSTEALDRSAEMATIMDSASQAIASGITKASSDIDNILNDSSAHIQSSLVDLRSALLMVSTQSEQEERRVRALIDEITKHIQLSAETISEVDRMATEKTSQLAQAVSALDENTRSVGSALSENEAVTETLLVQSERLIASLTTVNQEISQTIPASMEIMNARIAEGIEQVKIAVSSAESLEDLSDVMLQKIQTLEQLITTQHQSVQALMAQSDTHFAARHEQVDALAASLRQTRELMDEMAGEANERLVSSLLRVRETTRAAAESSRKILDDELAHISDTLTEQNREALATALDTQVAAMNEAVKEAVDRNISLSETAASMVGKQLGELDEMAASLQSRIADSKNNLESVQDDSFARRMVLLTESLNSTAIDVAKILSNDVTDTAWAAYLKGDRGVFTRRAVRLLDNGEAKIIATHYGEDSEFREHVNRYVHDFESIMRLLLSTRDGNAIGVTLLSSDIGKLYVALAQAIERLRK